MYLYIQFIPARKLDLYPHPQPRLKAFILGVGGGVANTVAGGVGDDLGCMVGEIGVHMDIIPHILDIGNSAKVVHGARKQLVVIHLYVSN